ncbi:MAG TPA: 16S rRNA (uracil(1498)-N(3))-methyltransferase, partial [Myxococcota bacterium]
DAVVGARVALPADVAHRFARVLRLDSGESIELFDDAGRVVVGRFESPDHVEVVSVADVDDALPPLVVVQALTKTDKLELVVQKATELGASQIVLFAARRCQVKLDDERGDKKIVRLTRIAQDAARQCGRARPPVVTGPLHLKEAIEVARSVVLSGGVAFAGVVDAEHTLSTWLSQRPAQMKQGGLVVIGPEGGLDPDEQQRFAEAGVVGVRFSRHVLRTETAALAALAICQAALGEA